MKRGRKLLAIVLSLMIACTMGIGLSTTAFGAGSGSITVKNATKGHTYTAYKVFDATYNADNDAVSYKTAASNAEYLDDTLFGWSAADSAGKISVWLLEDVAEADVLDWVEANYDKFGGTAITGEFDATNSTVTFKNLDYGYYYITSSLGTAVTIDSAAPSKVVYDKNSVSPTDPAKTIVSVDGVAKNGLDAADAHVGSTVGFKITAKTTNWEGEKENATIREKWEITDTPTNMTIDASTIVVKFNGTALTKGTDYTATIADSGALTINVPMVDENGNSVFEAPVTQDAENGLIPIEITYSATITKDAGDNPAKNEIPGGGTEIFTYAFQVAKTDDNNQPLPGAQFELWVNDAALNFIDNGDGTYTYAPSEGADTVTTLDMTTNTTISIKGLDNTWTYTLKEITVPNGYNPADPITVAGGDLTKVTEDVNTSMTSTDLYKVPVVNKQGTVLPFTGGIGTTIFYLLGALLVIGCGIVLVARRRMAAK